MGLLTTVLRLLVFSGVLALYLNYGRYLLPKLFPQLAESKLLGDWISLFVLMLAAYVLVKLVERRLGS